MSRFARLLAFPALLALLPACELGKSGSSGTTVSGAAVKGPIQGATVEVLALTPTAGLGAVLGSGTTDAAGNFQVAIGSAAGPVAVRVTGNATATYKNEATSAAAAFTAGDSLLAFVPTPVGAVAANVTPLTHFAALRIQQLAPASALPLDTLIAQVNAAVAGQFGIASVTAVAPADLTDATPDAAGTDATNYALVLAGYAREALAAGVTPTVFAGAVAQDYRSDGLFNGQLAGGAPVPLGAGTLSTTASTSGLTTGIANFLASPQNTSGVTAAAETTFTAPLAGTTLPPPPAGLTASPANGGVLLTWNSVPGATGYNVYYASATGVTKANYATLPDGTKVQGASNPYTRTGLSSGKTYYFVVTAINGAGEGTVSQEVSVTFIDTTPPVVTITAPSISPTFDTQAPAVILAGGASDNVQVTRVTWTNAGTGGSGTATGTTSWNATITLQQGENAITVTATDAAGNAAFATLTVTRTADTTKPVVAITSPTSATTFATASTPISLGGTASDNIGVTSVTWSNAATGATATAVGTTSWSASIPLASGNNAIIVTASDAAGNQATASINVTLGAVTSPNWLIMVYMAADDEVLDPQASFDINLMEYAPASPNVRTLVEVDTSTTPINGSTQAQRLLITHDTDLTRVVSPTQTVVGEIDTPSIDAVKNFVVWAKGWAATNNYPVDRYVLILWDHGAQWQGWGANDLHPQKPQPLSDVKTMLANIQTATGISKFDILGFDACLMASVEVDQTLSNYAAYRVASAELENGGWNYADAFTALANNPAMSVPSFGKAICDSFIQLQEQYRKSPAQTLSVGNLSNVSALVSSIDAFAASLNANLAGQLDSCIAPARWQTTEYGKQKQDELGFYIDLKQFARLVATTTTVPELTAAANNVIGAIDAEIPYRNQGTKVAPDAGGISIYFPNRAGDDPAQPNYTTTVDLAKTTRWDEFVAAYQSALAAKIPPTVRIDSVSSSNVTPSTPVSIAFTLTPGGTGIGDMGTLVFSPNVIQGQLCLLDGTSFGAPPPGPYSGGVVWDARVFAISDGNPANWLGARSVAPGSSLALSVMQLVPTSGTVEDVFVFFDLDQVAGTGSIIGVYNVTSTGGIASRQVNPGDTLAVQLFCVDLSTSTTSYKASPNPLTVPAGGLSALTIYQAKVPSGDAVLSVYATDYANNTGSDSVVLTVP